MSIEAIIAGLSYLGIGILLFSNGVFSFPSSQIVYLVVGYFVAGGVLSFPVAVLVGAIANTLGCIALYEFAREHGKNAALKLLPISEKHTDKFERFFRKKGLGYLFIGKLTPTLKVIVPIVAGVGKSPRGWFAALMFIASIIWASLFIWLGMLFGKSFAYFSGYAVAITFISLLVIIFFWISYRKEEGNE